MAYIQWLLHKLLITNTGPHFVKLLMTQLHYSANVVQPNSKTNNNNNSYVCVDYFKITFLFFSLGRECGMRFSHRWFPRGAWRCAGSAALWMRVPQQGRRWSDVPRQGARSSRSQGNLQRQSSSHSSLFKTVSRHQMLDFSLFLNCSDRLCVVYFQS